MHIGAGFVGFSPESSYKQHEYGLQCGSGDEDRSSADSVIEYLCNGNGNNRAAILDSLVGECVLTQAHLFVKSGRQGSDNT